MSFRARFQPPRVVRGQAPRSGRTSRSVATRSFVVNAALAQLAEHPPFKRRVLGSSPRGGTGPVLGFGEWAQRQGFLVVSRIDRSGCTERPRKQPHLLSSVERAPDYGPEGAGFDSLERHLSSSSTRRRADPVTAERSNPSCTEYGNCWSRRRPACPNPPCRSSYVGSRHRY
jgi:hypothetical protein